MFELGPYQFELYPCSAASVMLGLPECPQSGLSGVASLSSFIRSFMGWSQKFSISKHLVSLPLLNIITRRTLLDYCKRYPAASTALQEWYHELVNSEFKNFNELKKVYGNASIVADDRVVFNIMGNSYRLVVRILFDYRAVQIKWFGTHAEYDKIDVVTVQHSKR